MLYVQEVKKETLIYGNPLYSNGEDFLSIQ